MAVYAISILIVYLILSFLITTLYIRFVGDSSITEYARKHVYWFPLMPVLIVTQFIRWLVWPVLGVIPGILRYLFEKLSGKRTYRRNRSHYYKY